MVVTIQLPGRPRKRTSILGTTGDLCRFQNIQIASEAYRPSSSMAPGVERPGREDDHSHPSTEVTNE